MLQGLQRCGAAPGASCRPAAPLDIDLILGFTNWAPCTDAVAAQHVRRLAMLWVGDDLCQGGLNDRAGINAVGDRPAPALATVPILDLRLGHSGRADPALLRYRFPWQRAKSGAFAEKADELLPRCPVLDDKVRAFI